MMFLEGEEMYLTGEESEETLISTLEPATAAVLHFHIKEEHKETAPEAFSR